MKILPCALCSIDSSNSAISLSQRPEYGVSVSGFSCSSATSVAPGASSPSTADDTGIVRVEEGRFNFACIKKRKLFKMETTNSKRSKQLCATSRLKRDYLRLKADPVPYIIAEPLPSNLLEWHYVLRGPEESPFEGGIYHGKLVFPNNFPFSPPSIYMITPNGRFKTNQRLCLSISDFHPDTWNPVWSVSTILTGLLSFMLEKTRTLGSVESSDYVKRQLAVQSLEENLKHSVFCELFPDTVLEITEALRIRGETIKANEQLQNNNRSLNVSNNSSPFTNLFVIVVLIMFGYIIKYVLKDSSI